MNFFRQNREQLPRVLLFVGLSAFALVFLASAATGQTTITKAASGADLNAGASWSPSTPNPTAADIGNFSNTSLIGTLTFSSSLTLGEIKVNNATGAITLQPGAAQTFNLGNSTFANGGGIDMSNATTAATLTLGTNVNTVLQGSAQTWVIGNATNHPTLTINGTLNKSGLGLAITGNSPVTFNGVISGGGALYQSSSNTTTLAGQNTMTGDVNLTSGTLVLTNGGTVSVGSSLGLGTFDISGGNLNTSAGTVTMATNNNVTLYGGFTFVGAGNLNLGTGATFLANDATITVTANTVTFGGNITDGYNGTSNAWSNGLSITKTGAGGIALNGTNQFSGNFNMQQGTLTLNSNLALQNATLNYTGGTVSFGSLTNATMAGLAGSTALALPTNMALTLNTGTYDSANYSGVLSGTNVSINVTGNGTQMFSGANSFTTNATNFVTLSGGTLVLNGNGTTTTGSLGAGSATNTTLKITGGTLDTTNANTSIAATYLENWTGDFTFKGSGNLNTGTGAVTLSGATRTVTVAANTLTVGGVISGANGIGLTKNGSGVLVLNGTNTYNGTTTVNDGTLAIGNAQALGTGTNAILTMNGGDLDAASAVTMTANNKQNWNSDFTFVGTNTLSLGTGAVTMNASRTVTVSASTLTVGGTISGTSTGFSLTKDGTGTLVLTNGSSNYSGATIINGGTLSVATLANGGSISSIGNSTNGSANLIINGGTLQYTGTAVTSNRSLTVGTNGATLDDSGTGVLNLSSTSAIAFSSSAAPANLTFTGTDTSINVFAGAIGDSGTGVNITSVLKTGAGQWELTANSTYSGGMTLSQGTLNIGTGGNATASPLGTGLFTITGGNLDTPTTTSITMATNNAEAWKGSFGFTGTGNLNTGTGNVTLGANITATVNATTAGTNLTINGAIGDNGYGYSITKAGNGTLILNKADTFSGNLNLQAGTLTLGNLSALQNATLNYTGGTLTLGTGTNVLGGLAGSSNIALGSNNITLNVASGETYTYSGNVSGTGNITKNGSGNETFSGVNTYSGGTNINSGELILSGNNNHAGTTTLAGGTLGIGTAGNATGGAIGNNSATLTITGGNIDNTSGGALTVANTWAETWSGNFTFLGSSSLSLGTGTVALGSSATRVVTVNANTLTVGGVISGTSSVLNKAGAGTLVLTGVNTYSGGTNISGGTLNLDFSANAANNTAAQSIVSNNTALTLSGGNLTVTGNAGAANTNTITFSGTTVNAGAATLTETMATGTMTVNLGNVSRNAGGEINVVKGAGGASNFTANTTNTKVTNGIITGATNGIAFVAFNGTDWGNLNTGNIVAATSSNNLTQSAANWTATTNLKLTGNSQTITSNLPLNSIVFTGGASTLTLTGHTLTMNSGGILMSSNTTGAVTFTGGCITGQASAASELVFAQFNTSNAMTVGSSIIDNSTNHTIVTKTGGGQLILGGTNTYTGNTYLDAGTLTVGSTTALGATTSNLVITGGAIDANSSIILANNNAQFWNGDFTYVGSNDLNMGTGAVTMNGSRAVTVTAKSLTIGGNIGGAFGLSKNGSGTLVLGGTSSTFTGDVLVNAGVLELVGDAALGTNAKNVTVSSGAALKLDDQFNLTDTGSSVNATLSLNGTGISSTGALVNGNGSSEWFGNITLAGDASIGSGSVIGSTMWLGNTSATTIGMDSTLALGTSNLTLVGSASTTSNIASSITGTGNVIISTAGTVIYSMPGNSYLGTTNITNGTLILDTIDHGTPQLAGTEAINGNIIIGDGIGGGNTAILQMSDGTDQKRNSIASTASVTINSDGKFFIDGQDQTIANLTMNAGYINTVRDSLHLGVLTVTGNVSILANAVSAVIDGNLNLSNSVGNATNLFTVASGGNTGGDLVVNALISGGSVVKAGTGNMVLSVNATNSTYTGTTEVQAGVLTVNASSSANVTGNIGALGAADGSLGEGTTVDANATLQLINGVTVSNETLVLNGNGTAGAGALKSTNGTNVWDGTLNNVTVASNASINTVAGSLLIASNVTTNATNATLTFTGAGTTTVSGSINNSLNIAVNGSGTVVFNGSTSNSYTGNTTINSGATLEMNKTASTVAVSGSTITINSGGTLLSDASENVGNGVNMVLNGGNWTTNATASAVQENLNTLTLTATSNLNLNATSNTINFSDSSSKTWAGDSILYINSWNGDLAGGGTDQVIFGSSAGGLQGTSYTGQLGEIIFVNPTIDGVATSSNYHAIILSTGEVVPFMPAPEPGTVVAGAALGALALVRELRRRKARVAAENK